MKVHEWQSLLITLLYSICSSHCAAGKRQLHCLKETSLLAPIYHVSPTEMHSLCDNIFLPCENIHNSGLSIHLGCLIMDAACVLLSWQKTLVTVTVVEETDSFAFAKERNGNSKVSKNGKKETWCQVSSLTLKSAWLGLCGDIPLSWYCEN